MYGHATSSIAMVRAGAVGIDVRGCDVGLPSFNIEPASGISVGTTRVDVAASDVKGASNLLPDPTSAVSVISTTRSTGPSCDAQTFEDDHASTDANDAARTLAVERSGTRIQRTDSDIPIDMKHVVAKSRVNTICKYDLVTWVCPGQHRGQVV